MVLKTWFTVLGNSEALAPRFVALARGPCTPLVALALALAPRKMLLFSRLSGSHYIETVDIAKMIKMGSLHASQKWSFSEKKFFFGLNYQSS